MRVFGIIYIAAEVGMLLTMIIGSVVDSNVAFMVGFSGLGVVLLIGMIICIALDTWIRALFPLCFVPLTFAINLWGNADTDSAFMCILLVVLTPIMFSVSMAALGLGLAVALLGAGITFPIVAFSDY